MVPKIRAKLIVLDHRRENQRSLFLPSTQAGATEAQYVEVNRSVRWMAHVRLRRSTTSSHSSNSLQLSFTQVELWQWRHLAGGRAHEFGQGEVAEEFAHIIPADTVAIRFINFPPDFRIRFQDTNRILIVQLRRAGRGWEIVDAEVEEWHERMLFLVFFLATC